MNYIRKFKEKSLYSKINLIFAGVWLIIIILDFKFDMYSDLWTVMFLLSIMLETVIYMYLRKKNKR